MSGDADANRVQINGEPVLVLASSPDCVVVLPGPKAVPGPAMLSIEGPGVRYTANTTLVSLECEYPGVPLEPGKKGLLVVHVRGSDRKLRIIVANKTPGVLRFVRGTSQEIVTSGGAQNVAAVKVEAISSGDYSFQALLLNTPDIPTAIRYLQLAEPIAPKDLQHALKGLVGRLTRHPSDVEAVRQQLDQIIYETIGGDLRTLLSAAGSAL
jgi:hypothetical protein